GGLGVINDAGILNVSLIFPKHLAVTTDAAYEMMVALLQTAFPEQTILAYEIVDSYCPGTYDLSIDGKKIAGTAQRRIKDGVAVMMYLSINGDQPARGSLVRRFYQAGLKERFGTNGYPAVNPASMTTLEAALGRKFTTQEVIDRLQKALLSLISDQSLYPLESLDQWLTENNLSEQMQQRLAGMEKRNQPIKEFSDESTL
ncbi:lipoyl protein ligase domain-containing protein, partial [Enterococcus sp.]|uniref:lipoate--protein ligase family protein n=1 Tax=Enterococcus sp. TaxID=35783 RepID=UPI00289F1722